MIREMDGIPTISYVKVNASKLALQNCYGIQFNPVGWVGWPGPDVEEWGGALQSVRIGALIIRPVSLCRDAAEGASLHLVSLSLTMDK
ncbi:hypothetical protein LSTR_LSTR013852 [Laodelphax striatellus]|uniref:Uncharacterized protein n=1 Tax=Laodelphax striatellus TaxID=195883 RepID=A0A482WLQ8_LAOST|nr:hypothetical protein LSTR_LSTR013852 [Laodelphax striatellus]